MLFSNALACRLAEIDRSASDTGNRIECFCIIASNSFVIRRSLLERLERGEIVFNPHLGLGLLEEDVDSCPADAGLLFIVFEGGEAVERALLGEVIQVARHQ